MIFFCVLSVLAFALLLLLIVIFSNRVSALCFLLLISICGFSYAFGSEVGFLFLVLYLLGFLCYKQFTYKKLKSARRRVKVVVNNQVINVPRS